MKPLGALVLLLGTGLCPQSSRAFDSSTAMERVPVVVAPDRPLPGPALSKPEPRIVHSIGADYGLFLYQSTGLPISAGGASLFYRARFRVGISLSAGLRFLHVDRLPSGFGIEGFVGLHLAPQIGVWRPLAGIEVGATSLISSSLNPDPYYSPEEYSSKQDSLGSGYAGFVIAPLRFGVRRITFQALGMQLATHLPQWGRALRLQVLVGQLEWSF